LPDYRQPRRIAWLCPVDRRRVPADGGSIVLSWTWPGVAGPPPKPWWRLGITAAAIDAANAAILTRSPDGLLRDSSDVRVWTDTLFAALDPAVKERIYAIARRKRPIHPEPHVTAILHSWAALERSERVRRASLSADETATEVAIVPRTFRQRRRALAPVATIGAVPEAAAQSTSPKAATPKPHLTEAEEAALCDRVDAALASVDAILAAFPPARSKTRS
jgi:hypothetical protein